MTQTKTEKTLEGLLKLACCISLPLILLFGLTIALSLVTTGALNTDVNGAGDFSTVFLSFSLPMVLALGAAPLLYKLGIEKCGAARLGLALPRGKGSRIACVVMAAGSVLPVFMAGSQWLEVSVWTVWCHFFFVAVAEELMLRSVILDELRAFLRNKWLLCLVNGAIFAFVYHSNSDFLSNLLVRLPLGFVLCLVREESDSVYPAIALHWLYNMFVITI